MMTTRCSAPVVRLFAAMALILAGAVRAEDEPSPPGSAAVPPKVLAMPNPPLPAGLARAYVKLGVWIDATGAVEDAEFLAGTK